MDRMACVNLPVFPLQLLVKRYPDWMELPVAVIDKDKPQGIIQWVNRKAMQHRILPGMRYAKGLSLSSKLRAGVVSPVDVDKHIEQLTEQLRFYTPDIEASRQEPGVFWLNASGLSLLYPTLQEWGKLVGEELQSTDFYWNIAIGFTRYGSYAAARVIRGVRVFDNADDECGFARSVPIVRLGFDPLLRDALAQLGITTLGHFIDLPENGMRKRFGNDAHELYKLARDELYQPLTSRPPQEPFIEKAAFDYPETQVARLMVHIDERLGRIMSALEHKARLLASVTVSLTLDNGERRRERLRPASATVDAAQISKLIDLRLQKVELKAGVVDVMIEAHDVATHQKQLNLFNKKPQRDLRAVDSAFARLRAEFGDKAIMRARICEGHLPEACFEWEPMEKLPTPAPRQVKARNLARRIFSKSIALLSGARFRKDKELIAQIEDNRDVIGPYIISGGWWKRRVDREYYFVRNKEGRWLWIYYDRRRKRRFLQGAVE